MAVTFATVLLMISGAAAASCEENMLIYLGSGAALSATVTCHIADNDEAGCACMRAGNALWPANKCLWNATGNGRACDEDPAYVAPTTTTAISASPTCNGTRPVALNCVDQGATLDQYSNCVCPEGATCTGCGCDRTTPSVPYFSKFALEGNCSTGKTSTVDAATGLASFSFTAVMVMVIAAGASKGVAEQM